MVLNSANTKNTDSEKSREWEEEETVRHHKPIVLIIMSSSLPSQDKTKPHTTTTTGTTTITNNNKFVPHPTTILGPVLQINSTQKNPTKRSQIPSVKVAGE